MKIKHTLQFQLLASKQEPSKDGSAMYSRLAIMTKDFEAGMLPCSEDIYNMIQNQVNSGKVTLPAMYDAVTVYDDKFNYYRVEALSPVDSGKK